MSLYLKQDFDYQGNDKWLWSLGVYGPDEVLEKIEFVRYTLPPIFPQPTIKSTDRKSNFRVFEETYEPFRIYVKVVYKDGSEENMEHDLTLAKISIKNDCWLQNDGLWHWELSIEGDKVELEKIESVSYLLPDVEQVSEDQNSGFVIAGKDIDGLFRVGIHVRFCDGRCIPFEETLQLLDKLTDYSSEEKINILDNAKTLLTFPDIKVGSNIIEAASISSVALGYSTALPLTGDILSAKETGTEESFSETDASSKEADLAVAQLFPDSTAVLPSADETFTDPPKPQQKTPPPFLESVFERKLQTVDRSESIIPPTETVLDTQRLINNKLFPSTIEELRKYVTVLKGDLAYGLARKLLTVAQHKSEWQEQAIWIKQQLALCTYKDEDIPLKSRFEQALSILEEIGLRESNNVDSETLALGGAVYKRKWQTSGQLEDLHESLFFYQAAYERNPEQDMGYGGINAAFIMDLLADRLKAIATRNSAQFSESERLQRLSRELRQRMAMEIPLLAKSKTSMQAPDYWDKQYWYLVTLAEIHFGLKNYEEARSWLVKAKAINAKEWEKETLFKQLKQIGCLHGIAYPGERDDPSTWDPAWQTLTEILGEDTGRALTGGRGKVGLALSGGGFRASFFHLGVMARMAEIDALRSVEVLSTVSGGSILGAHYYLEVQKMLQTQSDTEIKREHYIELVRRVQKDFLQGVQSNIRMSAFTSFRDNLRMLFSKTYTRSHRLGELYESELFRRVLDGKAEAEDTSRNMPDLLIQPKSEAKDVPNSQTFNPKFSNWRRRAKVPILLLNSTSLNSGHNWQFTATWMGEPPGLLGGEIDVNQCYRWAYYKEMPCTELQKYRLGYAVAASACVPGLFDPLSISGLFDGRMVRLVDGGVHDNQGVAGLLNEDCTLILCSDASGQMTDVSNPTDDPAGVLMRSNAILQDRVREAEYLDLRSRLDSRALDGLFFVHTKKELEEVPLDWINCIDPLPSPVIPSHSNCTSYGVDRDLQKKIADIRTDLDAFTEVEAYALMASGYRMAKREFDVLQQQHRKSGRSDTWGGYNFDAPDESWPFRKLEPLLEQAPGASPQRNDLGLQLQVAKMTFFKVWGLMPLIKFMSAVLAAIFLLGLSVLLVEAWSMTAVNMTWGALFIGGITLVISLFMPAFKWLFPKEEARSILLKAAISLVGYLVSKVQIKLIDPLFLARGKLTRLLELKLPEQPDKQEQPASVTKK